MYRKYYDKDKEIELYNKNIEKEYRVMRNELKKCSQEQNKHYKEVNNIYKRKKREIIKKYKNKKPKLRKTRELGNLFQSVLDCFGFQKLEY